ncbi:hypothetical protein AWC38_SpisGene9668 [Stylophora pistillata]|uniref:Uncharacterized protein n=1 Tax=Stylophora pistillata TaxID=50429 RepID=A0A2B4SA42_STYPI|nr:hypothetical protein AWC38_SpisGene9668 [Stylophora pistillata]
MDLIDLIGDSKTDSLPAGFLRSIKIKYKQESSRVFPPGTPYHSTDLTDKAPQVNRGGQRSASAASNSSAPRHKLGSRTSVLSGQSQGSKQLQPPSRGNHDLPRLQSEANHLRRSPLQRQPTSAAAPASLPVVGKSSKESVSQDKNLPQELENARKMAFLKSIKKTIHPQSLEAVDDWLKKATDKERQLALKFFSTLSGVKADKMDSLGPKINPDHTKGNCEICDSGRVEEALEALAREGTIASCGKLLNNPKRVPDITKQSYYQKVRQRLPVHVRQQFQTWHHLPVYKVPSDAAINKSSMFTQPHKAYGRHFTIHPEWGLHKPILL